MNPSTSTSSRRNVSGYRKAAPSGWLDRALELNDTVLTRSSGSREAASALLLAAAIMPKSIRSRNTELVRDIHSMASMAPRLFLVADILGIRALRTIGKIGVHVPGFRANHRQTEWLVHVSRFFRRTFVLVQDRDIGRSDPFGLAADLAATVRSENFFVTRWAKQSDNSLGLACAVEKAIACQILCQNHLDDLDDSEVFALIFLGRFAQQLVDCPETVGRVARLAAKGGAEFKTKIIAEFLPSLRISKAIFLTTLGQIDRQIARKRYRKSVERALVA